MSDSKIMIATSWDSFNPVVYDDGQAISTRVLERRYRMMHDFLITLSKSRQHIDPETIQMALDDIFNKN